MQCGQRTYYMKKYMLRKEENTCIHMYAFSFTKCDEEIKCTRNNRYMHVSFFYFANIKSGLRNIGWRN